MRLILKEQIMHLPEFPLRPGRLRTLRGQQCVGVRLLQREVTKYEANLAGISLEKQFRRRRRRLAARALEIAVLDHRYSGMIRSECVIGGLGRHDQRHGMGCLSHGSGSSFYAPVAGTSTGLKLNWISDDRRKTVSSQCRPIQVESSRRCKSSIPLMGAPSIAIKRSPISTPARAAGLIRTISRTCTALRLVNPKCRTTRVAIGTVAPDTPIYARLTRPWAKICPMTHFAVLIPVAKQIACAWGIIAVFTPITRPLESPRGPPESPGLSAASV